MFRFVIDEYRMGDLKALRRALGRRNPVGRAVSWALRLALLAVGLLFGLTVAFFWGTFFGSGHLAALRPGSNDLAVAVICHTICLLTLLPALGWGRFRLRRLLRARNWQTPLTVTLDGGGIGLELPRWTDSLPYSSVEAVCQVRGCWVLFLKNRRVLILPERCLVQGRACSLETFFESRTGVVTHIGGTGDGV